MIIQQLLNIAIISAILTYSIKYCRENAVIFIIIYILIYYMLYIIFDYYEANMTQDMAISDGGPLANHEIAEINKINSDMHHIQNEYDIDAEFITNKPIPPLYNIQTQLGENVYINKDCGNACIQRIIKDDNILLGGINNESLAVIARDEYTNEEVFFKGYANGMCN